MRRTSERRPVHALTLISVLTLLGPGASADAIRSAPRPRSDLIPGSAATPSETPSAAGPRSGFGGAGPEFDPEDLADARPRPSDAEPAEADEEAEDEGIAPAPEAEGFDPGPLPAPPARPLPGIGAGIAPDDRMPADFQVALPPRMAPDRPTTPDQGPLAADRDAGTAITPPGIGGGVPAADPVDDRVDDQGAGLSAPDGQRVEQGLVPRSSWDGDRPSLADSPKDFLVDRSPQELLAGRSDDGFDLGDVSDDLSVAAVGATDATLPSPDAAFAWDTGDNLNRLLDSSFGAEIRRGMFHALAPDPVLVVSDLRGATDGPGDGDSSALAAAPRSEITVATPEPSTFILIGLAALVAFRIDPKRRRSSRA